MLKQINSIPNILGGIMIAFLAIIGVRVTYPMADLIIGLWTETTMMKVTAILIMWLIYFFVLWVFVWAKFFQPKEQEVM